MQCDFLMLQDILFFLTIKCADPGVTALEQDIAPLKPHCDHTAVPPGISVDQQLGKKHPGKSAGRAVSQLRCVGGPFVVPSTSKPQAR